MYRCPTCIAALPDPTSRRCPMCAQHLRRRRPRVLGEEHRIGARMLPIDRALVDRLRRRTASLAPVPATAASPAVAGLHGDAAPEVTAAPAGEPDPIDVAAYLAAFDAPRDGGGPADAPGPIRPEQPQPAEQRVVPLDEVDPEIKALVAELYERARAEILGTRAITDATTAQDGDRWGHAPPPAPRRRWVPVEATDQYRGDDPRAGTTRHDR